MYSYGSPHTAAQKQDDQHERTFSSCVRIQDVVLKTCLGRWTIGRSGERGSGISVLPARYDDDDEFWLLPSHLPLFLFLDRQFGICLEIFRSVEFYSFFFFFFFFFFFIWYTGSLLSGCFASIFLLLSWPNQLIFHIFF